MRRTVPALLFLATLSSACGESREEKLRREMSYEEKEVDEDGKPIEKIPADPDREALRPLLEAMYTGNRLPDVLEGEIVAGDPRYQYDLTAGALSKVTVKSGLSAEDKAYTIIQATAEADAWVHRDTARRDYAEHIQRVHRSISEESRDAIQKAYAELKLLDFFNSDKADAAIAKLSGAHKTAAEKLKEEYTSGKEEVWGRWMGIKMYARREVAGDEPFKTVLRDIRKELGKEEPPEITWEDAHDPVFMAWGKAINDDEKLFKIMTNLKDPRDQEEFRGDTHTIWAMEGSDKIPEKAKGTKVDPELGFGVHSEDLGAGYKEMTFVFSKKLKGADLKKAYLRSHIYRHLMTDFAMLAKSGGDFEGDMVPDKYDPEYAYCGSHMAIETFIHGYKDDYPLLSDLKTTTKDPQTALDEAHACIIEHCKGDIHVPDPDDPKDVEGPAPGSRLAFFQAQARFELIDVDTNAMRKETPKSQEVLDAEAFLKENKNEPL